MAKSWDNFEGKQKGVIAELERSQEPTPTVFSNSAFRYYQFARFFIVLALEMQSVAVGWQIYEITKRPLDLGYVGLAQFLPGVLLFLVSGHVADRVNRRNLAVGCYAGFAVCSGLLLALAGRSAHSVAPIYMVLVVLGVVRSFNGPVSRALLPKLVAPAQFESAVAWASGVFQGATVLGPALGGLGYALFHGPAGVYATAGAAAIAGTALMMRVDVEEKAETSGTREPSSETSVLAGLRYIWREKIVLGAISLDLFAVLLGGAVALLPVYAREILHTGPWALGLLRSAPAAGAGLMAIFLGLRPLGKRAGVTMLWCVAGFGAFTILFGISHSLMLSLVALFFVGATDMVSVVVRGTLIQVATPDEMRGRVNAVDMIFIGASNELGQFESGLTAHWLGTVPAVVLGGIGTLLVTGLWAWRFPQLRDAEDFAVKKGGPSGALR